MSNYRSALQRYNKHRSIAKELLEEEALHKFRMRVDVVSVDEDILRRVRRDWYGSNARRVGWDWERDIIPSLHRAGARSFDFAMLVKGQLCGIAAARVSHGKRWISLTHVEGCPDDHPLKGCILPMAINALFIYRAVICSQKTLKTVGIRVLNPLEQALTCYNANGYTLTTDSKWLRSIVIEQPIAADNVGEDDGNEAQADAGPQAEDGAGELASA